MNLYTEIKIDTMSNDKKLSKDSVDYFTRSIIDKLRSESEEGEYEVDPVQIMILETQTHHFKVLNDSIDNFIERLVPRINILEQEMKVVKIKMERLNQEKVNNEPLKTIKSDVNPVTIDTEPMNQNSDIDGEQTNQGMNNLKQENEIMKHEMEIIKQEMTILKQDMEDRIQNALQKIDQIDQRIEEMNEDLHQKIERFVQSMDLHTIRVSQAIEQIFKILENLTGKSASNESVNE